MRISAAGPRASLRARLGTSTKMSVGARFGANLRPSVGADDMMTTGTDRNGAGAARAAQIVLPGTPMAGSAPRRTAAVAIRCARAVALLTLIGGLGACATDAPSAVGLDAPPRDCGAAWAERGHWDGRAGRPPADPAPAIALCAAAGLPAPDVDGYAAEYGAGRYLAGFGGGGPSEAEILAAPVTPTDGDLFNGRRVRPALPLGSTRDARTLDAAIRRTERRVERIDDQLDKRFLSAPERRLLERRRATAERARRRAVLERGGGPFEGRRAF